MRPPRFLSRLKFVGTAEGIDGWWRSSTTRALLENKKSYRGGSGAGICVGGGGGGLGEKENPQVAQKKKTKEKR